MRDFSLTLIDWYHRIKRDLPWRKTKLPYNIWLSEIMLQQTQVVQGLPYYLRFVEQFPTITALAMAQEDQVLKLWQGLGYYSRARNLYHTAKYIANELQGVFPDSYKELIKLKGVGDYTASAIASICFGEPVATVDGNVFRVLSRVFGISTPINNGQSRKEFKDLAQLLLDKTDSGTFNQAIMEFGALQCKPKNPNCKVCVFNGCCYALRHNKVELLPVKLKTVRVQKRYFDYIVFKCPECQTVIKQRQGKGIWRHLYEFPLIEGGNAFLSNQDIAKQIVEITTFDELKLLTTKPIKHKLSHQDINIRFWEVITKNRLDNMISWQDIESYPVPAVIQKFLESYKP